MFTTEIKNDMLCTLSEDFRTIVICRSACINHFIVYYYCVTEKIILDYAQYWYFNG